VFYRLYFFNISFNDLDNNRFLPDPSGLDEFCRFTGELYLFTEPGVLARLPDKSDNVEVLDLLGFTFKSSRGVPVILRISSSSSSSSFLPFSVGVLPCLRNVAKSIYSAKLVIYFH